MDSEGQSFRLEVTMTNEQRRQISDLRHQGFGYAAIANAVGLSKDSVKAYCRSHGLGGVKADTTNPAEVATDICLNCGAALVHKPGAKRKKFCNPICRQSWWNAHPDQVKRKALYTFQCPACGKPFTSYGNDHRKYCSRACYINARFKGGGTE